MALAPIWAKFESEPLAVPFAGRELGKRLADIVNAANHDLTLPKFDLGGRKLRRKTCRSQTGSNPVNPVKPDQTWKIKARGPARFGCPQNET
jgi:hypothetical protein